MSVPGPESPPRARGPQGREGSVGPEEPGPARPAGWRRGHLRSGTRQRTARHCLGSGAPELASGQAQRLSSCPPPASGLPHCWGHGLSGSRPRPPLRHPPTPAMGLGAEGLDQKDQDPKLVPQFSAAESPPSCGMRDPAQGLPLPGVRLWDFPEWTLRSLRAPRGGSQARGGLLGAEMRSREARQRSARGGRAVWGPPLGRHCCRPHPPQRKGVRSR